MIRALARTLVALVVAAPFLLSETRLPLFFEPSSDGEFVVRSNGQSVRAGASGLSFDRFGMRLIGGRRPVAEAEAKLPGYSNYFIGNDPRAWRLYVPQYARVRYRGVYPGIDLVYYSRDGRLEFDFIVAPGADPQDIQLAFTGAWREQGEELLASDVAIMSRPVAYQGNHRVAAAYRIEKGRVEFALARYNRAETLIIDPVVEFSRYLGGAGRDLGVGLALDSAGNPVVTGVTNSDTLPVRRDAAQALPGGATDAFVAKFSRFDGSLQWITYLGGKGTDSGASVALDRSDNIIVAGDTTSADYPVRNAAQGTYGGGFSDAYVTKLNPAGTAILYSTFTGGGDTDFGNGLAIDRDGNAYTAGWTISPDFPTLSPFQSSPAGGGGDVFVRKLNPSGQIVYSTFVGGPGQDLGTGVAVDSAGSAYVTGRTTSTLFPLANALQRNNAGDADAFLIKLSPSGNGIVYGTFLGGSGADVGYRVAVDATGSAIVTGYTESANFPTLSAAQSRPAGKADVFVTKVAPTGDQILFSTYVGGSGDDFGFGNMALDAAGTIYVTGYTNSTDFPLRNAAQSRYGGGPADAFVFRLAPSGSALLYSTYLGGRDDDRGSAIAVDAQNGVLLGGGTASPDFPRASNSIEPGLGAFDIFVAKLTADDPVIAAVALPATLDFSPGASQSVRITASAGTPGYTILSAPEWLQVNPRSGVTPVDISLTPIDQAPGSYSGVVTVQVAGTVNSPLSIPVRRTVAPAPLVSTIDPGSAPAGTQQLVVLVRGSGFTQLSQVRINETAVPVSYLDSATLQAVIPGLFLATPGLLRIVVTNPGSSSPPVSFPVEGNGPFVRPNGIVNAATFLSGPAAPGQFITIFGSGLGPPSGAVASADSGRYETSLQTTRVFIDDEAAPVVYAGENQITAIMPYSVSGKPSVRLEVEYQGKRSSAVGLPVVESVPGVFLGQGGTAAINEDQTANSAAAPAARGSLITFTATGTGLTSPIVAAGQRLAQNTASSLPIRVRIGGADAEVASAGGVTGSISGLTTVTVRVPAEAMSGMVEMVLQAGEINSIPVTIWVR